MRLTIDKLNGMAKEYVKLLAGDIGGDLAAAILNADQKDEAGIF